MDEETNFDFRTLSNISRINSTNTSVWVNETTIGNSILPPRPPTYPLNVVKGMPEYQWAEWLVLYVFPPIVICGTIGNGLSFTVMCRNPMKHMSTCFYLSVMAVADTGVLYFNALRRWVFILTNNDAMNIDTVACRMFNFLTYFSFHYSVWLLVAMTIERYIGIHFPLKAPKFATVKRAKKVTMLLFAIFFLINCHFFWTVDINIKNDICQPTKYYLSFFDNELPWIDAILYSFLPFSILGIFNILIIIDHQKAVNFRASVRRSSYSIGSKALERHHFHHKLTVMLLTVSFMFIITSAPRAILFILRFDYFDLRGPNTDLHHVAVYLLVSTVTSLFTNLTHAINFLLYCISGQRFRQELWKMLTCQTQAQRRHSTISTTMCDIPRSVHRPSITSTTDIDESSVGPTKTYM